MPSSFAHRTGREAGHQSTASRERERPESPHPEVADCPGSLARPGLPRLGDRQGLPVHFDGPRGPQQVARDRPGNHLAPPAVVVERAGQGDSPRQVTGRAGDLASVDQEFQSLDPVIADELDCVPLERPDIALPGQCHRRPRAGSAATAARTNGHDSVGLYPRSPDGPQCGARSAATLVPSEVSRSAARRGARSPRQPTAPGPAATVARVAPPPPAAEPHLPRRHPGGAPGARTGRPWSRAGRPYRATRAGLTLRPQTRGRTGRSRQIRSPRAAPRRSRPRLPRRRRPRFARCPCTTRRRRATHGPGTGSSVRTTRPGAGGTAVACSWAVHQSEYAGGLSSAPFTGLTARRPYVQSVGAASVARLPGTTPLRSGVRSAPSHRAPLPALPSPATPTTTTDSPPRPDPAARGGRG